MEEVETETIDRGAELTPPVQLVLDASPIVLLEPGAAQLGDRVEAQPLARVGRGLGQAHAAEPFVQVSELLGRHVEHERHDLDGGIPGGYGCVGGHGSAR